MTALTEKCQWHWRRRWQPLPHGCQGMGGLRGVLLTEQRQEAQVLPGASQAPQPEEAASLMLFSLSVVFNSLRPQGLQHARLPFHPLLELAQTHVPWVGDAIQPTHPLSSLFSSCVQSFPASWSFPVSRLFASGGQSTGVSVSASVFPMTIKGRYPLELTSLLSLLSKRLSRVFSSNTVKSINSSAFSLLYNSHICTWLQGLKGWRGGICIPQTLESPSLQLHQWETCRDRQSLPNPQVPLMFCEHPHMSGPSPRHLIWTIPCQPHRVTSVPILQLITLKLEELRDCMKVHTINGKPEVHTQVSLLPKPLF